MIKVLIACEFSGIVRDEFTKRGHNAWSCDLLPTERPGNHIQDDVLKHLDEGWDLMIAHPPCCHLSVAGAAHWEKKRIDGRQQEAAVFFLALAENNIPKIAVENPPGIMTRLYRKPNQYIEPYQFGHPCKKKTGLWLKNLSLLVPTNIVKPEYYHSQPHGCAYRKKSMRLNSVGGHRTKKNRSRTFQGIAEAMAEQWG